MAYYPDPNDPFSGGEKVPSLSWKDLPVGSTFTLEVLEPAKTLQSRNYDTNEPDYWDAEKTRPRNSAVVNVRVVQGPHSVGEDRSIWAQIPSNLFIAIKEAQKKVERRLESGGILHLRFTGTVPHENKRFNPIKQYEARYTPPKPTGPDAFDEDFPEAPTASPTPTRSQPAQPQTKPQPATASTGKPRW